MYLIVNENGSDNIGDHAINEGLQSILSALDKSYRSVPFASFGSNAKVSQSPSNRSLSKARFSGRLKNLLISNSFLLSVYWFLKNIRRVSDCVSDIRVKGVLVGGGQLILSGSTFPIAMATWVILARFFKKPIWLVGVGCGEKFSRFESFLLRLALKRTTNILVREAESIDKLRTIFGVDAFYCPDLAFGLSPLPSIEKKDRLVVGVTDYNVYLRYHKEVGAPEHNCKEQYLFEWRDRLLALVSDPNIEIVFASTTLKDLSINNEFYNLIKDSGLPNMLTNINELLTLTQYRYVLANSKIVFSGRMHSLILGKIEGCVVQPWLISKKLVHFMQNYKSADTNTLKKDVTKKISELLI
jgi:polysaccharide pyruvyl transferase WcaK-like protein